MPTPAPVTSSEVLLPKPSQESMRLVIRLVPKSATLTIDGIAFATGETIAKFSADGKKHVVRAEAVGYVPATFEFTATSDDAVDITLARAPAQVRKLPTPAVKTRAPVVRPAPEHRAPKVDCEQPFSVDARGIKRLRPECF